MDDKGERAMGAGIEITEKARDLKSDIVDSFATEHGQFVNTLIRNQIKDAQAILKEALAEFDGLYIAEYKGKQCEVGDKIHFVGEKKTEKYDTQAVYAAINGLSVEARMDALTNLLPPNPKFNKKPIYALMEWTGATDLHSTDISDKVEVKDIPKKLLKERANGPK